MAEAFHTIPLTNGLQVRVSEEDYDRLVKVNWHWNGAHSPYAARAVQRGGKRRKIYLHREVMLCPPGMFINHRDGDTLNCTRENLHPVRPRANSTVYRVKIGAIGRHGVWYRDKALGETPDRRNVRAGICTHRGREMIGSFHTVEEACRMYDARAVELLGFDAITNYPLEEYLCPVTLSGPMRPQLPQGAVPF